MNRTCGFISPSKFKITNETEQKIYCTILMAINKGINSFIFKKDKFNDLCYNIVTQFRTHYPNITRIGFVETDEFACLERDRKRMENLFFFHTKKLTPFRGYEHILDASLYSKAVCLDNSITKNERLLDFCEMCVVYSPNDKDITSLLEYAKQSNITILQIEKEA